VFVSCLLFVLGTGCACEEGGIDEGPTWHADVAPIVSEHCSSCHSPGNIAPFSLLTYENAEAVAGWMVQQVEDGLMPPWGAQDTDECGTPGPWQHDPRLSDAEISILAEWSANGMPEGDPDTAAPLPSALSTELADVSVRLTPEASYQTGGTADELICFSLDPGIDSTVWFNGFQANPGNPEVVHHVLLFADAGGQSETLVGSEGYYPCFGGVGINSATLIGGWVPGALPTEYPESAGLAIEPGDRIVMQVHYHPTGGDHAPDLTTVDVRWVEDEPPYYALMSLQGNASDELQGLQAGPSDEGGVEFRIPADAQGHTETIVVDLGIGENTDVRLWAVAPHMHLVGVDMKISVLRDNPGPNENSEECLVHVPNWDFDWQRIYQYDLPIDELPRVDAGDTIELRCTYDNSLDNPGLVRALDEEGVAAPQDVYLGEGTLDEMCIGAFGAVVL